MWIVLFCIFFNCASGMENPTPISGARKYSCCPEKFGYHFVQMNAGLQGRENIHLCDLEGSKTGSDNARVTIGNPFFINILGYF